MKTSFFLCGLQLKKVLLLWLTIICVTDFLYAQEQKIYKIRTESVSYREFNQAYDYWNNWEKWEKHTSLIVLDFLEERVRFYMDNKILNYDIIKAEQGTDRDGDSFIDLQTIDDLGQHAQLRLVLIHNEDDFYWQLYLMKEKIQFVFNVNVLD